MTGKILPVSFFTRPDVAIIAKELLGKCLATNFDGNLTVLRIVETEAYNGAIDKASHAFNNRKTNRTKVMYEQGGVAYVYLCYGIHQMFNIVTNIENVPHAILIRGGVPVSGIEIMASRTNKKTTDTTLSRGPGNVCKALGIHTGHSGFALNREEIFIYEDGVKIKNKDIGISPRIGVDYSGEDALLPYRFYVKGNDYVSGKWRK
ncbi:MAG: DNA-3-methyladenine glycosylase [Chitinophagaceae bacterium]